MAVAHFPSGSVLTCSTFFDTANAGDVITSSDATAPQVANTPLLNDASHRLLESGPHYAPRAGDGALARLRGSPPRARRKTARKRPDSPLPAAPAMARSCGGSATPTLQEVVR